MTREPGRGTTRRELLKLSPVLLLGAFAVPSLQEPLLRRGVALSDAASVALFRRTHLARKFPDTDVVPFDRFPHNYCDVVDPRQAVISEPSSSRLAMCALLAFIAGHLVMVAIHGWDNFRSMLIGWKMRPEYEPAGSLPSRSTAPLNDS